MKSHPIITPKRLKPLRLFNQFAFLFNCLHFACTRCAHDFLLVNYVDFHTPAFVISPSPSPPPPLSPSLPVHKWKVVSQNKKKYEGKNTHTERESTLFIHEIGTFAISSIWFSSWFYTFLSLSFSPARCWCCVVDTTYICMYTTTSICQLNKVYKYLSFVDFTFASFCFRLLKRC